MESKKRMYKIEIEQPESCCECPLTYQVYTPDSGKDEIVSNYDYSKNCCLTTKYVLNYTNSRADCCPLTEVNREEKELVKKYCPFYSIPGKKAVLCSKTCAWHKDDKCAIITIAEGFSLVEQGIYGAIPWAGCKHEL